MNKGPHERAFVLEVPAEGVAVARLERFDLYRPATSSGPLPAVVFVHGPVPPQTPARPRDWPVYQGYGRLAAAGGLVGLIVDLDYPSVAAWPAAAGRLGGLVEVVRARPEVDADRVALWAFSGGGLLVGRWLADSPTWLGCVALSYPLLPVPQAPGAWPDGGWRLSSRLVSGMNAWLVPRSLGVGPAGVGVSASRSARATRLSNSPWVPESVDGRPSLPMGLDQRLWSGLTRPSPI
jgi:hypothetical protein